MSDLLKRKNPKRIEKGVTVKPESTFSMDEFTKPKATPAKKKPAAKPTKQVVNDTTTVRISGAMRDLLNAMVTVGLAESIDQLTDMLSHEYMETTLTKDQRKQVNIVYEMYRAKNNRK